MRNRWLVIMVVVMAFGVGLAAHQILVPDIEAQQRALFRSFEELERLGAYVIGADGENLGRIARSGSDALGNKYGAGSPSGSYRKADEITSSECSSSRYHSYRG